MFKIKKGFTIIELLVVIAIIGILATLVTANLIAGRYRANYAQALSDMTSIADAARMYKGEYKRWPPDEEYGASYSWEDTGLNTYLPNKPVPPCKPINVQRRGEPSEGEGWNYDWENWDVNPSKLIRVDLRHYALSDATGSVINFLCLDKGTTTNCKSGDDTSPYEITELASKTLKCDELNSPIVP